MRLFQFSIYDKVSAVFNKPFTDINSHSAIRSFEQSLIAQKVMHKADYDLYILAEYDDSSGQIQPLEVQRIRSGLDISNEDANNAISNAT